MLLQLWRSEIENQGAASALPLLEASEEIFQRCFWGLLRRCFLSFSASKALPPPCTSPASCFCYHVFFQLTLTLLPPTCKGFFITRCMLARSIPQSCPSLCNPCSPPDSSVLGIILANTGVGCQALLQGIFLTQGSSPQLPHLQVDSLPRRHLETPITLCLIG